MGNIYSVQFITDKRYLIPGTGNVAVKGQVLEIGPGKTGANFPYRSPKRQIDHYGNQIMVLLRVTDELGEEVEHADIGVNLDGGPSVIDAEDASLVPDGIHEALYSGADTTQVTNVMNKIEKKEVKSKKKIRSRRVTKENGSSTKRKKKTKSR